MMSGLLDPTKKPSPKTVSNKAKPDKNSPTTPPKSAPPKTLKGFISHFCLQSILIIQADKETPKTKAKNIAPLLRSMAKGLLTEEDIMKIVTGPTKAKNEMIKESKILNFITYHLCAFWADQPISSHSQPLLNTSSNILMKRVLQGTKTRYNFSIPVNQKFREIPLN